MKNPTVELAVNGTLMRGLSLNQNLLDLSAEFVREDKTAACYRLWSIEDRYPGMIRDHIGGASIEVEIWSIEPQNLAALLQKEPPGLTLGKVELINGIRVLGILAEPYLVNDREEITEYLGWRSYTKSLC